ncbi:hypothetical protein JTB14_008292 [Gonioctena quinquepunctata]|nr:hypothetical protein JTB14_008292 [Gonioctena quinquepunctata]
MKGSTRPGPDPEMPTHPTRGRGGRTPAWYRQTRPHIAPRGTGTQLRVDGGEGPLLQILAQTQTDIREEIKNLLQILIRHTQILTDIQLAITGQIAHKHTNSKYKYK